METGGKVDGGREGEAWDVEVCHSNSYIHRDIHTYTHPHRPTVQSIRHETCNAEVCRHTSYSVKKLWQDGCCITAAHRSFHVIKLNYS